MEYRRHGITEESNEMSLDNPENLKTIFGCIGILSEEINKAKCSKGGIEVFFKLVQLKINTIQEETSHK